MKAESIDDYVEHHRPNAFDETWYYLTEYEAYQKLSSPHNISLALSEHEDHHLVEVDRSDRLNKFKLHDPFIGYVEIEVSDIEDILELPCFQNIDDYLKDRKPTRWVLYSIARVLMSLNNNFTIDDMVGFYSRYPWFDEDTTRYQLNYEQAQTIDGETPMPISCNNDNTNFGTFCIGKENCDYSIYQSLPMRDEIYDRLETNTQ